jgi:acyl carrier protein
VLWNKIVNAARQTRTQQAMTEQDVFAALTPIFRAVLSDDAIVLRAETTPRDFAGWDSFRYIEIILQVEEALGVLTDLGLIGGCFFLP